MKRVLASLLLAIVAGGLTHIGQRTFRSEPAFADSRETIDAKPEPAAIVAKPAPLPMPREMEKVTVATHRRGVGRTLNFVVLAPTQVDADEFARLAEQQRKQRAIEWLGRELPPWSEPCRCEIEFTEDPQGGETKFQFKGGQVISQNMKVKGPRDWLSKCALPHEISHTIFANHFGQPVPRWADEGGAMLSEDAAEQAKWDRRVVKILNAGEAYRLSHLFRLKQYPDSMNDTLTLYAEGHSVAAFLVARSSRADFLEFVSTGMVDGWEVAAQRAGFRSVEDLEESWIESLRKKAKQPAVDESSAKTVGVNFWWLPAVAIVGVVLFSFARSHREPTHV